MLDWIRSILGTLVHDGQPAKEMLRIPCIVRQHDGASFTPGTIVNFGLKVFIIKHIFISRDLLKCNVMVIDTTAIQDNHARRLSIDEEFILNLDEVIAMPNWRVSEEIQTVAKLTASDSFSEIFCSIPRYPTHLKKAIRKFTLVSKIRKTINYFLTGLDMVGNYNLGLFHWDYDPQILMISNQRPRLIYKIEDSQWEDNRDKAEVDTLLGPKWDIADLSATLNSYRIVLTLEIRVNSNAELILVTHAGSCNEVPEMQGCYRSQYLRYSTNQEQGATTNGGSPQSTMETHNENDNVSLKSGLVWDSFNKGPERASTPLGQVPEDLEDSSTNPEASTFLAPLPPQYSTAAANVSNVSDSKLTSVFSESGSSRPHSRVSRGSTVASSNQPRLQGIFGKASIINPKQPQNQDTQCPFPNEWQYGSVPEVITNDEDVD